MKYIIDGYDEKEIIQNYKVNGNIVTINYLDGAKEETSISNLNSIIKIMEKQSRDFAFGVNVDTPVNYLRTIRDMGIMSYYAYYANQIILYMLKHDFDVKSDMANNITSLIFFSYMAKGLYQREIKDFLLERKLNKEKRKHKYYLKHKDELYYTINELDDISSKKLKRKKDSIILEPLQVR